METVQTVSPNSGTAPIHLGHLGAVLLAAILLVGASWLRDPQLFSVFSNNAKIQETAESANVPHYYAYVAPTGDQAPQVLGASTDAQDNGPMIIGDDGTVQPVDAGQVLGASTEGVNLPLSSIQVKTVPDSTAAIQQYFSQAQTIESNAINQTDFASALSSGDQTQINLQMQKLTAVETALEKLAVPHSLAQLQKLKIVQYNSAITLLQNFTQANQDPDLVTQNLQDFIKAQQDLDSENTTVAEQFPTLDPMAAAYVNSDGTPLPTPTPIPTTLDVAAGSTDSSADAPNILDNADQ